MKHEYKVGDTVTLIDGKILYGRRESADKTSNWAVGMNRFFGKIVTITHKSSGSFKFDGCSCWDWEIEKHIDHEKSNKTFIDDELLLLL